MLLKGLQQHTSCMCCCSPLSVKTLSLSSWQSKAPAVTMQLVRSKGVIVRAQHDTVAFELENELLFTTHITNRNTTFLVGETC